MRIGGSGHASVPKLARDFGDAVGSIKGQLLALKDVRNPLRLAAIPRCCDTALHFNKSHSVEGHIAAITIKKGDTVYLGKLSNHGNMKGLRDAVRKALEEE
ncbi:hypothetical protein F5B17DRAFT_435863 [Nemania serpens]|nr:hypothetical protein F5B17DRAFT_435863 [Nemania serpens]